MVPIGVKTVCPSSLGYHMHQLHSLRVKISPRRENRPAQGRILVSPLVNGYFGWQYRRIRQQQPWKAYADEQRDDD
jgi:hypothetical protein